MRAENAPKPISMWDESAPRIALGGAGSEVFRVPSSDGQRQLAVRFWCGSSAEEAANARERVSHAHRVEHASVAAVEGCEPSGKTALFLVSEYVPGPTLEAWARPGRRLALPSAIELGRRLCLGVQAGLRQGISHHGIHPRNIVLWRQGSGADARVEAKLLDLALTAFMQPELPELELAHFMAPESLRAVLEERDPSDSIDARANVFSCGALLYFLCTGTLPFLRSELPQLSAAHAAGEIIAPSCHDPRVSAALECVIMSALAVNPTSRYGNPGELASALAAVELRDGITQRRSSVPPPTASESPRHVSSEPAPAAADSGAEVTVEANEQTPASDRPAARPRRMSLWVSLLALALGTGGYFGGNFLARRATSPRASAASRKNAVPTRARDVPATVTTTNAATTPGTTQTSPEQAPAADAPEGNAQAPDFPGMEVEERPVLTR